MSQQLFDDFARYTDKYHLIQEDPGQPNQAPSGGNGLLYLALFLGILERRKLLSESSKAFYAGVVLNCELQSGLYKRHPEHTHQQGPDDYLALAYLSRLLTPLIAERILLYGRKNRTKLKGISSEYHEKEWYNRFLDRYFYWVKVRYNYNNVNPGTMHRSSWIGRQPQLVTAWEFAAGERPNWFRKLAFIVTVHLATKNTKKQTPESYNADYKTWLLVEACKGKSWTCNYFGKKWTRATEQVTGGDFGAYMCKYFANPDHPVGRYW